MTKVPTRPPSRQMRKASCAGACRKLARKLARSPKRPLEASRITSPERRPARAARLSAATELTCTPEAKPGDYVLVHVGVAISVVDAKEAEETFRYLQQMGELDGLDLPAEPPAAPAP